MEVVAQGILGPAVPGSDRCWGTSPAVVPLPDGALLASMIVGSGKDADDQAIELRRSTDGGRTWSAPERPFAMTVDGVRGSFKAAPITALGGDRLIMAALWVDREAFPGAPLFHPVTEGCLPMAVLVADSDDAGRTWSPWRTVPMTADVGPPSLTSAILRLPDGRLALSVETNKPYLDASPWFQRVVYLWSSDLGRTWTRPRTVVADPTGRIANWDQRTGLAPDGRLVSFTWTYDFVDRSYLDIHRRLSSDGGASWTDAEPLGVRDQAAHPAVLPDGRVVLAWVDRFGAGANKARRSAAPDAPFDPSTEVVIHQDRPPRPTGAPQTTGDDLVEMGTWTYGLPYAEALPDGDVLVVHYAGSAGAVDIRWARLRPGP
jgi:hypothetical protein